MGFREVCALFDGAREVFEWVRESTFSAAAAGGVSGGGVQKR